MPAIKIQQGAWNGEVRFDWNVEADQTVSSFSVHGLPHNVARTIRLELESNDYSLLQVGGSRPDDASRFYETLVQTLERQGFELELPVDVGVIRDPELVR